MGFSADITAFCARTKMKASTVLRVVALKGYSELCKRSPVDTGRFRGSWRVGINRVDGSVEAPREGKDSRPQGSEVIDPAMVSALQTAKFGDTIHITNSLEYAGELENGKSSQAPEGMLRLTAEVLKDEVSSLVAEVKAQ